MEAKLAFLKGLTNNDNNNVTIRSTPYTVGRCRTAELIIAHINVSRNHCQIVRQKNIWEIHDSSSSGTFVNDVLIGKGKSKILCEGDIIRFGPVDSNLSWAFYPLKDDANRSLNFNPQAQALVNLPLEDENYLSKLNCYKENFKKEKPSSSTFEIMEDNTSNTQKRKLQKDNNLAAENRISLETLSPKKETLLLNPGGICSISNCETTSFESDTEIVKRLLEDKLIKQEEEKKLLLLKIAKMEEAHQELFQKLNVKQKKLCDTSYKKNDIKTNEEVEKENERKENLKKMMEINSPCHNHWLVNGEKSNENENLILKSKLLDSFTDLMETELQCTICSELFVAAVTLSCTHTFCKYCINQWKKKQKTCPICRKKITNETRSLVVDNYIDKMVENLSSDLKKRRETLIAERKEVVPAHKLRSRKFR